jgi:hypothetical protein
VTPDNTFRVWFYGGALMGAMAAAVWGESWYVILGVAMATAIVCGGWAVLHQAGIDRQRIARRDREHYESINNTSRGEW